MFSNGSEYDYFSSYFCERCNKYKPDAIEEDESCPIEYQIALTSFSGNKKDFPYKDLKKIGYRCRYACKHFECDDKEIMKEYHKLMKGD